MIVRLCLIPLSFLICSCSSLVENFKLDIFEENDITPLSQTTKTICEEKQDHILISENKDAQKSFNKFFKKLKRKKRLTYIDEVVLWSLLQMSLRPDLSSPSAKLQVLIKIDGKEEYLNSYSKSDNSFPFLNGLESLLIKYKSKHSLLKLASLLDKYFKESLYASKDFSIFLNNNKNKILEHKKLQTTFTRGDETLKEHESIPKFKIANLISIFYEQKKETSYKIKNFLFSFDKLYKSVPQCNFDMGLYNDSLFLINKDQIKSHIFGLKSGKNSFMAVSSQKFEKLQTIGDSIMINGKSNIRSASLCSFKHKFRKDNTLWLISTESRDPGQHLFHLIQYGLDNIRNMSELTSMLKFSRHQFLKDPVRLILESRKSSEQQLNNLLNLNIPIYNSKRLGKVWGYYQETNESSFVLDDRLQGHLECNSK